MAGGVYKGLTIELNADTSGLNNALRKSNTEANKLQRELNKVQKSLKVDGSNSSAMTRQFQLLEQSIDAAQKKLERLRRIESEKGSQLNTDAWTKLQYEIEKAENDIEKYREQISKLAIDQAAADSALGRAGSKISEIGDKLEPVGQKMQSVGRTMTTHVTVPIVAAATASVKAATDIDTALTGVRKTVDGTEEQYQQLKQAAIEFSKVNAVSAEQVLNAQALGAQLGFTIDELDEFSRVATGMEIATDMGLEDAASEMAQFANITQMSHAEISNYASAIVNLGNNLATTESKVSAMGQRIAAAGTQVKMTQADILGWAGAMSSLGVEAEAGGTAFSQFVSSIDAAVATGSEDLQKYADVAGMSADEFAAAWQSSSTDTLQALLKGIAGADNMTVALESMGVTGVRQSDVLKRLAGNTELVGKALGIANTGWQENTALANEVANRNDSLAAKFEMLKNRVIAVAEEVGKPLADAMLEAIDAAEPLFEAIENGAKAFSEMSDEEQQAVIQTVAIIAALGPALSLFGKVTSNVKVLGGAMTSLSKVVTTAGIAMGKNIPAGASQGAAAVAKMGAQSKLATTALGGLQGAAVALAVAGIAVCAKSITDFIADEKAFEKSTTGLVDTVSNLDSAMNDVAPATESAKGSVYRYGDAVREVSKMQGDFADSIKNSFSDVNSNAALAQTYIDKIKEIQANYDGTAESAAALQSAVDGYNSVTGDSVTIISETTGEISKSTEALQANADAWKAKAYAQAAQNALTKGYENQLEIENQIVEADKRVAQAEAKVAESTGMNAEIQADAREELQAATAEREKLQKQSEANQKTIDQLSKTYADESNKAREAADAVSRFAKALSSATGDSEAFSKLAASLGVGVDELAAALDGAGISSEQLARVGSESFAELYRNADGNMNLINKGLKALDAFEIETKDFEVTDEGTIKLENGMVIDLDKRTIDGKHFYVTDDGTIYTEDGAVDGLKANIHSVPSSWQTEFQGDDSDLLSVVRNIKDTIASIPSTVVTSVFGSFATGGILSTPIKAWAHADGGMWGIVDRPTMTNVGLVGEAGAEAVLGNKIIPLTNKQYTKPFAKTLAEQMGGIANSKTYNESYEIHANDPYLVASVVAAKQRRMWS